MRIILIIILLFLSIRAFCPNIKVICLAKEHPVNVHERLINAIVMIESNGNNNAYNPIENACGAFQIRPIRLKDYNKRTGNNLKISDCFDYEISKKVFLYYANQYDYRDIKGVCRNWNGKSKGNKYYNKILSVL
jgi:hypothetical protein